MTVTSTALPSMPDPSAAHNVADLADSLADLRARHGRARPRGPMSLRELARHTGIPRSTLHTYFTGAALAPAPALDRILIVLDCPPPSLRVWARARERIAASAFGSPTRHALPINSRFLAFAAMVDQECGSTADERSGGADPYDQLSTLERAHLAEDRSLARLDVRIVVRARREGVDRYTLRIGPKPGQDPDRVNVSGLVNCSAGGHRTVSQPGVRALELTFDHPLDRGEPYMLEFTVDFASARIPGSAPPITTELARGFRRAGAMYALEAMFPAGARPHRLRQIHLSHIDAEENVVAPVALSQWDTANILVERPAAGLHGLRWDWTEHP
ncbi:MAG: hypothetical protein JWQ32_3285 [Marmoricola sp.]|nr:hypothetical protein [Marmoricola sp.]